MGWLPTSNQTRWLVAGLCAGLATGLVVGIAVSGIKPATTENSYSQSKSSAQSLGWDQLDNVYKTSQAFVLSRSPVLYKNLLASIGDRFALLDKSDSQPKSVDLGKSTSSKPTTTKPVSSSLTPQAQTNGKYLDGTGEIDINSATLEQIDAISRMSTGTAKDILNYIKTKGPIKSFDELDTISGVGPKTIEKLRASFHINR